MGAASAALDNGAGGEAVIARSGAITDLGRPSVLSAFAVLGGRAGDGAPNPASLSLGHRPGFSF